MRRHLFAFALSLTIITASLYLSLSAPEVRPPRVSNIHNDTKYRMSNQSTENTLVVVPVNSGALHLANNLLCSLTNIAFNVTRIVFWALDLQAKGALESRGFTTYHDPNFYSVSTFQNVKGDTQAYKRLMLERPKFFIDILSTGFDILFLDADTVFAQSPMLLPDPSVDFVFSTDSREFYQKKDPFRDVWRRGSKIPPVCNGIFWMKSNARTIKLWQDMLDIFNSGWRTAFWRLTVFKDDQRGMDVLLNDGRARLMEPLPNGITKDMLDGKYSEAAELDIRLLDQTAVASGHIMLNRRIEYEQNLDQLRSEGKDKVAMHLNWDTREMTKEDGAKMLDLWLLDKDGNCKPDLV